LVRIRDAGDRRRGLGAAWVAGATTSNDASFAPLVGTTLAVGAGIISTVVIDAAVIAREPADSATAPRAAPSPRRTAAHIEPSFGLSPEKSGGPSAAAGGIRAVAGVVGTF
jgi:hypothetical protein